MIKQRNKYEEFEILEKLNELFQKWKSENLFKTLYIFCLIYGFLLLFFYFLSIEYLPLLSYEYVLLIIVCVPLISFLIIILWFFAPTLAGYFFRNFLNDLENKNDKNGISKNISLSDNFSGISISYLKILIISSILFIISVIFIALLQNFINLPNWTGIIFLFLFFVLWFLTLKNYIQHKIKTKFDLRDYLSLASFGLWLFFSSLFFFLITFFILNPKKIEGIIFSFIFVLIIHILSGFITIYTLKKDAKHIKWQSCLLFIAIIMLTLSPLVYKIPIRILKLGQVPIVLKINKDYAQSINQRHKKIESDNDGIIEGCLLSRFGTEYVLIIYSNDCDQKSNPVIYIPKEKVEWISFKNKNENKQY